ncbi:hypothetical protein ACUNWD_08835 [Sunxiuqinia sp. A32]|uniref:hypothetical protein n=1 Tax=Sunxiuqinia sp. A32 TaxID=3461496 RepID=UPI00404629A4
MRHTIGIFILTLLISCSTVRENEVGVILDSKTTEVKRTINGPKSVLVPRDAILKTMDKSKIDTVDLNFLTKDGKQLSRKIKYSYSINPERIDEYLRFVFSRYSDIQEIKKKLDHSDLRAATRNAFGNFYFNEFKMQEMPEGWLNEVQRHLHENYSINSAENIK